METQVLTRTPADVFKYQNDMVRTGKVLPLGRMRTLAIGPDQSFTDHCRRHPEILRDPYIGGWGAQPQRNARGRMMDFSGQWLPIARAADLPMILVTATMRRKDGYGGLPDLVDPLWSAPEFTKQEATNPDCDANCRKVWDVVQGGRQPHGHVQIRGDKDKARMIPQRLEDRTGDCLDNDGNILVFQPVLRLTYQPESLTGSEHGFQPAEWKIEFRPDEAGVYCAFVVWLKTGECHFFGGVPVFGGDTKG